MSYNIELVEQVTRLVIQNLEKFCAPKTDVPVSISARHLHLERNHVEILFGKGYHLTPLKPLSQPGQFAATETVDLIGPKGMISKVRILGPERPHTQVEVAMTDARSIGLKPPVRTSGDTKGSLGITIRGPQGEITILEGVIITDRHIHMTPEDARNFNVQDGQKVNLLVHGDKGGILHNVSIRVSNKYSLDCHIDTDDANAFQIQPGQIVSIISDKQK
ncbi:MAG: phosphate propanoyltransferase [Mobilitalea sp.]